VKALVQREDSLIKPRQSQNRISGFSTDSVQILLYKYFKEPVNVVLSKVNNYVLFRTWASELHRIYELEPKGRKWLVKRLNENIRILQIKINEWYLVEKIELNVYVNQHDFVSDIQTPSRSTAFIHNYGKQCIYFEELVNFGNIDTFLLIQFRNLCDTAIHEKQTKASHL
jgi:hypothetical protein